jgi:hypothetical protein
MANLITVPTFTFEQGDLYDGGEQPIRVEYYNGSIALVQGKDEIILHPEFMEKLFKEIRKHYPDALARLAK